LNNAAVTDITKGTNFPLCDIQ